MSDLATRIEAVYERIHRAAARTGRKTEEISLVAVTKTYSLATVIEAYQAGLRHFGESRTGEGQDKAAGLTRWLTKTKGERPTWHFIGHLQNRQVVGVSDTYQLIHSVDSLKLAERINRLAERDNHPPVEILLQCNVSGEATKFGFPLDQWTSISTQFNKFLETVDQIGSLNKIVIRGLMTIAPWSDNPEDARPTFQSLNVLRETIQTRRPQFDWRHLSMGMTDDFEVAIEEGATIVRIGRAIFGERA